MESSLSLKATDPREPRGTLGAGALIGPAGHVADVRVHGDRRGDLVEVIFPRSAGILYRGLRDLRKQITNASKDIHKSKIIKRK